MKFAGVALAAFLLVSQPNRALSEDRGKTFLLGTYLGYEMQDGDTNGTGATMHRTYYVRTDVGVEKVRAVLGFRGLNSVVELVGIAVGPMK